MHHVGWRLIRIGKRGERIVLGEVPGGIDTLVFDFDLPLGIVAPFRPGAPIMRGLDELIVKESDRFTAIISPTCPVAGYLNCLIAGPQPLQVSLAYRLLLPDPAFAAQAFRGPYALTATYVKRPR